MTCTVQGGGSITIAEHEKMLAALRKTMRAHRVLSGSSQALLHGASEQWLLEEICRICVEVAGYRLAWVGFSEQGPDKAVRPVAQAGFEDGYLESAGITWADTLRGQGPTGTAIRTGKPCVARDILVEPSFAPWRAQALSRGYASSASFPFLLHESGLGTLNVYAREPDAFDRDELGVLHEVAVHLAFGLSAMRTRLEAERSEALNKALQTQLEQARRLEAVGRVAGTLAHDFNNMLCVVIGCLSSLQKKAGGERDLDDAQAAARRAADLVKQLLSFARRSSGTPTTWDLSAAVRDIDTLLARLVGPCTLELRLHHEPCLVCMDRGQFEQILANLVVNARDAMPRGGAITIHTRAERITPEREPLWAGVAPGPYALLEVTDTGTGMTREVRDRIFEPFFSTKAVGIGTGLGLASAYGLVTQAHGHIRVVSSPGAGSSFRIALPIAS